MKGRNKRVFLDYASTTPTEKQVVKAMKPFFRRKFANPSAYYREGEIASDALNRARKNVAQLIGVKIEEVVFTGSGTEADNLAIFGLLEAISDKIDFKPHIIVSQIEHPAIMESVKEAQKRGIAEVTYLPVLENGLIDTSAFKQHLRPETVLVSVILANNEIGVIQSIRDINKQIKKYKNELGRSDSDFPYLHTDASQAPCFLDVNLDRLGVNMMTLDGSKIYGPKGVGCLIKKSFVPISSIMYGGGQESRIRPGTENVGAIVGFARALELADLRRDKISAKTVKLQKYFFEQISKKIPQAKINGSTKNRIANNVNIYIPGINSEFMVIALDEAGVACSAMTACKSFSDEASSYVVDALGFGGGKSSLRFTLGINTRKSDIDFAIQKIEELL
jgi:cysteine desulfurase